MTIEGALAWHDAGCSVLRVKTDGTKEPQGTWKQYQTQRATVEEIVSWFSGSSYGVGVICGAVSGNLELLEFEGLAVTLNMFQDFMDRLQEDDPILFGIILGGYIEESPGGGVHLYYRCVQPVAGNLKLAVRPDTPTDHVLIETRGEGGYSVVAPTGGQCHSSGRAWRAYTGSPATIPTLTTEQRETLLVLARELDERPPLVMRDLGSTATSAPGNELPGEDFNNRATWAEILTPHGWTFVGYRGHAEMWRRPGKDRGHSALADDKFCNFSSSVPLPQSPDALSKFRLYTMMNYGQSDDDFRKAASSLRKQNYGGLLPPKIPDGPLPVLLTPGQIVCTPVSLISAKRRQWFWTNRIPMGELTIFAGHAGVGKSQGAVWLSTQASLGQLEGEMHGTKVTTMYIATEDDWERTLKPRFMASGADQDLVMEVHATSPENGAERLVKLSVDLMSLELEIQRVGAGLIVFDALLSTMDDLKEQGTVRKQLEPLSKLAQKLNVSIVAICHFRKQQSNDPLMMLSGSAEFGQVIRSGLAFVKHKANDGTYLMGLMKTNIAPQDVAAIQYRIESRDVAVSDGVTNVGVFVPFGESQESIKDHLSEERSSTGTKLGDCKEWIKEYLENRNGIEFRDKIMEAGEANGHPERTIYRARKDLNLQQRKLGFGGKVIWWLSNVTESEVSIFASHVVVGEYGGSD